MDDQIEYKGYFVKAALHHPNPESGKWIIRALILNPRGDLLRTETADTEFEGTEQDAVKLCLKLGCAWVDK